MTSSASQRIDLLTLASEPMPTLVAALRAALDRIGEDPTRVEQVAEVIVAEAIRLIRLGTRREVADGAVLTTELMVAPGVKALRERLPAAHRSLSAAAKALNLAASPASKGSELAVLRSWAGNARRVVGLVSEAAREALPRAQVRQLLDVDESYLSHLLSDLEAAGLVERVRAGREVTIHLGPVGRQPHVQELVCSSGAGAPKRADRAASLRKRVERFVHDAFEGPTPHPAEEGRNFTLLAFERRAKRLVEDVQGDLLVKIWNTVVADDEAVCRFQLTGKLQPWAGDCPFDVEQVISVKADDRGIASMEWWSPPESWPRRRVADAPPVYETTRIEMAMNDLLFETRGQKLSEVPLPGEEPRNDELAPTAEARLAGIASTETFSVE